MFRMHIMCMNKWISDMLMIVKLVEAFLYISAIFSDSKKVETPGIEQKARTIFNEKFILGLLKRFMFFLYFLYTRFRCQTDILEMLTDEVSMSFFTTMISGNRKKTRSPFSVYAYH